MDTVSSFGWGAKGEKSLAERDFRAEQITKL
jgi:hypothetical protein